MDFPPFNRLETLNIWVIIIVTQTIADTNYRFFENLQGHKLTQGLFTQFYSSSQIVGNLLVLLAHNQFPSLHNLAMEYPFDLKENASKVTDSLLEFLIKHQKTITKFKLCVNLFITEEPNDWDSAEDRNWVSKAKAASKLIKLKQMDLNICSIYKVRLAKIWNAFVEAQNSLDSVSVMTFRLEQNVMRRICEQNFKTLVSIGLTRLVLSEEGRSLPIDCTVFETCSLLKSLFLEGIPANTVDPGIINVFKLPKTLEKVELGSLPMYIQDSRRLLTEFPNMRNVFLGDIGHQGDFGVEVETIKQVIRDRKITFITLYGCVNGAIPEDGIPNGNPDNEVRINVRYYGMLELKLNPQGYYEPIPREPLPDMFVDDLD